MKNAIPILTAVLWCLGGVPCLAQEPAAAEPEEVTAPVGEADEFDLDVGDDAPIEEVSEVKVVKAPRRHPYVLRGLTLPQAETGEALSMQLNIEHRGYLSDDLKVGISVDFGITDFLELNVMYQNQTFESYITLELGLKGQILREKKHFVDLSLAAGVSWFIDGTYGSGLAVNGALLLRRSIPGGVDVDLALFGTTDSSAANKSNRDYNPSMAVGGELSWTLPFADFLRLAIEAAFPVWGFNAGTPHWAAGLTFLTYRHGFSVVFSNNRLLTTDGLAAGSSRDGDDLVIGFVIMRQFDFGGMLKKK